MASTEFKVVSWAPNDPITDDKLLQMNNNDNWLFNNTPRAQYSGNGTRRTTGIKIASGVVQFNPSKSRSAAKAVSFNSYFSSNCVPIITTGIISAGQRMIWVTLDGLGSAAKPSNSGFTINVYVDTLVKKKSINSKIFVNWTALGF